MSAPPRYAPEIRIAFDRVPAPAELRGSVTSVSCQTGLGGSDRLELSLVNERLRWLDDPLLRLGAEISFAIGYAPDSPTQIFVGEVTGTEAAFPSDGVPTLRVVAQDRRTRLAESSPTRLFAVPIPGYGVQPLPDLGVAPLIGLEHQLVTFVDPLAAFLSAALSLADLDATSEDPGGRQKLARKQIGQSSLDFLGKIAAENGWEVLMEHGPIAGGWVIRLMSPASVLAPEETLRYGQSLIDFTPRLSTVGQVAAVSVKVWRPEIKLELTVTVGYDWEKRALRIEITPGFLDKVAKGAKAGSETKTLLVNEPVTVATAPRMILSKLLPKLNRRLTASGSCVGTPTIAAGEVLRIEGVGEQFGGLYRVTQARHSFDGGGYRTSFDVRKEIWFDPIPLTAQGAVRLIPNPLPVA
ncbi:MAG: hypothetical protein QOE44_2366 [Solirubrobacteraceae bacterium]|nr:hypothetical protein [Solirubrobacteraceae bacterium]